MVGKMTRLKIKIKEKKKKPWKKSHVSLAKFIINITISKKPYLLIFQKIKQVFKKKEKGKNPQFL